MARSFFITRAPANSEDPTALEFFPPKGSDELHEALKEAFPFEANLAARMRAAVIEFLLHEQQAEQLTPISTEYLPSPQSTFISTMPSPAIATSQTSQGASPSRRQSLATGQPSQEALMDVWSLPNKPQAKVHTRRTMTSEEKKAYKQKRLVGACADCKRRRRKCEHNSAGGSSIVPQKVGKHKKRVHAAASVCKSDAAIDFSWSAPGFNFDEAMGSTAMPMKPEMPSFDFDAADFDFSPDLSDDWQLFPDLPMVNNNYADSWSPDHLYYDASLYSPQAGTSQSRVSAGPEAPGLLSHSMHSQAIVSAGESYAGAFGTGAFGTATIGNLPISPVTPDSLSPMSRTQSASGDLPGQTNYNSTTSHTDFLNFKTGAHVEQTRVSRDKPIQVPLPTPDSLSPLSRSQSLNDSFAGSQTNARVFANATFRSDRSSALLQALPDGALLQTVEPDKAQNYDRGSLRNALRHQDALGRMTATTIEHYDAEASLAIQEPHQTRGNLQSSSSTETSHTTEKQPSPTTRPSSLTSNTSSTSETPSTSDASSASTMSRLMSNLSTSTMSRPRIDLSKDILLCCRDTDEGASRDKERRPHSENRPSTDDALLQENITSCSDYSLGQAPICVALYAAYCAIAQSNSSLAIIATLLLGAIILSIQLRSVKDRQKLPLAPVASNILRSCTKLSGLLPQGLKLQSNEEEVDGRRPSSRSSWIRSMSSHLWLLRATDMV